MTGWDETLYAGAAAYYVQGRMAYPSELAVALRDHLQPDGTGRLLDIGCGPGGFTIAVAGLFAEVVGADPDAEMLEQAAAQAELAGVRNIRWLRSTAEELPELGLFDVISFAQSFHWLDRPRVASAAYRMLAKDGVVLHVHATTHRGVDDDGELPRPRPPYDGMAALVAKYLGPEQRAGRGTLPNGTPGGEDLFYRNAGFTGPERIVVGGGEVVERTEDQVVAGLLSLSSSTPALFGPRLPAFEEDLRALLRKNAPDGRFAERRRETAIDVWSR
jgi:SAM-dependent methyltransferase